MSEMEDKLSYFTCSCCENEIYEDDAHYIDNGDIVCPDCYENLCAICSCCHGIFYVDDLNTDYEDRYVCESCTHDYYTCYYCDALVSESESCYDEETERDYCPHCFDELQRSVIHKYSYKPEPIFYGEHCLGVELEIDSKESISFDTLSEDAKSLQKILNADKSYVYIKRDGSLQHGFEIVTHPISLFHHMHSVQWRDFMKEALSRGYRSHSTTTCGIHVHVSRSDLGTTPEDCDASIDILVQWVEHNWDKLLVFSRRRVQEMRHWAKRFSDDTMEPLDDIIDKLKSGNVSRYTAINFTNYRTIEWRIFRGSLIYETLLAILQFVHLVTQKVHDKTLEFEWSDFVASIDKNKYKELIAYLDKHHLS